MMCTFAGSRKLTMIYFKSFIFGFLILRICQKTSGDVCTRSKRLNICQVSEQSKVSCAGGFDDDYYYENKFVSSLSLCYWPEDVFDPNLLSSFPNVEYFALTLSPITEILHHFPETRVLQVLNISYTPIEYLDPFLFTKLLSLRVIDLRYNNLHFFDAFELVPLPDLRDIHLIGNQWHCNESLLWFIDDKNPVNRLIKDSDMMVCRGPRYNGKPLKQVMFMLKTLNLECPKVSHNCTCTLDHVIKVGSIYRPMITVNCSHRNVKELPIYLPNNTSTLIMSGNAISKLDIFMTNDRYINLFNVYLDYNNISSIYDLEGSPWLHTFRALSLKGNKLIEVPIYVLEYAFEKNANIANLFLSENPWKCDCVFTSTFKDFLTKYRKVIKDVENVKCGSQYGNENSHATIIKLKRNKICQEVGDTEISFLRILNYVMAVVLVLLIVDFMYNYYMYKKYNQLPWIVSKLS